MDQLVKIQNLIYEIRGCKVMLDSDLAKLYGVQTFNLNKAVKRNSERFPKDLAKRVAELEHYFIEHFKDYKEDMREIHQAIDLLMNRTQPA